MTRAITGAAIAAVLVSAPLAARADDVAKAANGLLAAQVVDAVTTRAFLQDVPGSFERDPLARPFVHSNAAAIGAVIVTNLIARTIFRHAPVALRVLTVVEGAMVVNNFRVLER